MVRLLVLLLMEERLSLHSLLVQTQLMVLSRTVFLHLLTLLQSFLMSILSMVFQIPRL